jgi:4-deoxy-L-threo-5-hexosulose-uronate ketol-isomerase
MLTVEIRHAVDRETYAAFDTDALRESFLVEGLFAEGEIRLCYTHYDRMIVGAAVPDGAPLTLDEVAPCGTKSILDRREMVVVNVGGPGTVAAGETFELGRGDMVYLGRGAGPVTFAGAGRFYILSAPAHAAHPSRRVTLADAKKLHLGSNATSNERTINQFVVPEVIETCQLVAGMTGFAPGSVWNTMPAHVHDRRMEAYLYFDLADDARVVHLMGEPHETRAIIVANEEVVLSPPWSIHCGAGTSSYTFIWAMAGDNVDYKDVEVVPMSALR